MSDPSKLVHDAVARRDIKEVSRLLTLHPHLISSKGPLELSFFYTAAVSNNPEMIAALFQMGCRNINDGIRETIPIFGATLMGYCSVVELFVRLRSGILNEYHCRWTPMHYAANYSRASTIETLVRLGSSMQESWCYESPMDVAIVEHANIETVKTLHYLGCGEKHYEIPPFDYDEQESSEIRFRVYFRETLIERILRYPNDLHLLPSKRI